MILLMRNCDISSDTVVLQGETLQIEQSIAEERDMHEHELEGDDWEKKLLGTSQE